MTFYNSCNTLVKGYLKPLFYRVLIRFIFYS